MELKFILRNEETESERKMIDSLNKVCFGIPGCLLHRFIGERKKDGVMILGLRKRELADKILSTNDKFHYGNDEGCW